jgi:hypothetical protein
MKNYSTTDSFSKRESDQVAIEKALDKLGIPTERIRTIVINDGMEQNPELLAGLSFDKPRVPPPSNKDDADEDCFPDSNSVHDRRLRLHSKA